MNKSALALSATLSLLTLGTSAALAAPITGVAGNTAAGISDAINVGYGGYTPSFQSLAVTQSQESSCLDPVAGIHGCSFSTTGFTFTNGANTVVVSPNAALSNEVAVFYEPDGSGHISDLVVIGCETNQRDSNGRCIGATNFSIITIQDGFTLDLATLTAGLNTLNMTVGFEGTEIAGANATVFGLKGTGLATVTGGSTEPLFINFVSSNELPEPVTMSMFGLGLAGAVALRRRKRK